MAISFILKDSIYLKTLMQDKYCFIYKQNDRSDLESSHDEQLEENNNVINQSNHAIVNDNAQINNQNQDPNLLQQQQQQTSIPEQNYPGSQGPWFQQNYIRPGGIVGGGGNIYNPQYTYTGGVLPQMALQNQYNMYQQNPGYTLQPNRQRDESLGSKYQQQYGQTDFNSSNFRRNRPTSAKVVQGKKQQLSQQQSKPGSLLNLHSLTNNQNPQNQVRNFSTFDKQQSQIKYEDTLGLKIEKNMAQKEASELKQQIKSFENELKRKDTIIRHLMEQTKKNSNDIVFMGGSNQQQQNLKNKEKIRELKNELILKQEEIINLNRSVKFTKIKELENEVDQYKKEMLRFKNLWIEEMNKPRIDPILYQKVQEDFQQQRFIINNIQQEVQQLNAIIQDKDRVIVKKDKKINNQLDKLKFIKDRYKNSQKKIKVLKAKLSDLEKFQMGLVSKNTTRARNFGGVSLQQQSQSYSSRKASPGREGGATNKNQSQADWFEKYIIEKTKNERILKNLEKYGNQIDLEGLYQETNEQDQQTQQQDLINIQVKLKDDNSARKNLQLQFSSSVTDLKAQIQQQFDLQQDFVLRLENGQEFEQVDQLNLAQQNLLTIEFKEDDQNYENEEFEEAQQEQMTDCVSYEEVKNSFKEMKLKFQIKKVPKNRIFRYIVQSLKDQDGNKIKSLSIKQLQEQLKKLLKMGMEESLLISRYLIEVGDNNRQVAYNEELTAKRSHIKKMLSQSIEDYTIYNGLQMTRLLNRVIHLLDDKKGEIQDFIREIDEEFDGEVTLDNFYTIFQQLDIPQFEQEVKEFFEFLVFRQSDSLSKINYYAFLEIFDDDYLIDKSPYEDDRQFEDNSVSTPNDSIDQNQPGSGDGEVEIDEEELMIIVDDALQKITSKFPVKIINNLYKSIRPSLNAQTIDQKQVYYLLADDFIKYLREVLKLNMEDKEIQCLLHILIREDLQGVILYDEFKSIIKNFLKKEQILVKSISQGIRYDLLQEKETLDFLAKLKQLITVEEGQQAPTVEQIFQKIITQQLVSNKQKQQTSVLIMEFEEMIGHLFMKYQIRCPRQKTQNEIKMLFWIDEKYKNVILVRKVQKILNDFEYIYVNLLKIVRNPVKQPLTFDFNSKVHQQQLKQQQQQPPVLTNQKLPSVKKGVSFQNNEEEYKHAPAKNHPQTATDFNYDEYRKRYTLKAEEVPEEDEIVDGENAEKSHSSFHTDSKPQSLNHSEVVNNKKNVNRPSDKEKRQQPVVGYSSQQKQAETKKELKQQEIKKEIPKQQQNQQKKPQYKMDDDDDIEDEYEEKEEKMEFDYDPYRKKYTQKAETIEDEDDIIEDNYE